MKPIADLLENIQNPPAEFTPIPFWFFNDAPDEKKIAEQLKDYVDKGVQGIILHPRIGIPKEVAYLSEAYFAAVRFVLQTASQLDMKIVLYDEGMYPSGSAHGMVVAQNHEYASKGIRISKEAGSDRVLTKLSGGRYLVYGFTGGTIRGVHFGEDDGETGAPLSADILNPQAVKSFIHLTHDRYYEEFKSYFGTTIIGFFTDEPCALGRNSGAYREWAEGMEAELEAAGGKTEELEGLFNREENFTTRLYHKIIKKRLRETFYAPLSRWCEDHGIALMGHPAVSDDVEEELYFHIPGQDLIMRRVVPMTGGLLEFDSVQAKLPADIARHLGRRRNSNECFGVCSRDGIPWYFTGADMKWYLDWLGIRGVNLFIPHAFYYSVAGKRKEERPPDVGPHNIWWKHYRMFSDYMKRLSFLMTDSKNGAVVAVLCDNNRVPYREVAKLYENQIEFNYLPVALLKDAVVEDACLCIQGYRYEVVLDVLNDEVSQDGKLQAVKVLHSADEIQKCRELRTLWTEEKCKNLRAVHLTKDGTEMYLLSNEGAETIHTKVAIPTLHQLLSVHLWKGTYCAADSVTSGESTVTDVILYPCETLLLLVGEPDVFVPAPKREVDLGDWTERFSLVSKENNRSVYEYRCSRDVVDGAECFTVVGEEMAECYCNGNLADVSFWNPHRLQIGTCLSEGENIIKLVMTGNAANRYSGADIFYGLQEHTKRDRGDLLR
ncbi:MAG: hypothetical protein RSF83_03505 [Hungatella sp.]